MEIIFICTGNTCRSPMAEAYIKKSTGKNKFYSAGIDAIDGLPASKNSLQTLKDLDIDLENHRSQRVTREQLERVDLVLTMTFSHKQRLLQGFPELHEKIYTLKEYIDDVNVNGVVARIREIEEKILQEKEKLHSDVSEPSQEDKEKFLRNLEEEIQELNDLYDILESLDIKDPFGGDLEVYRASFKQIKAYIDILIEKVEGLGH